METISHLHQFGFTIIREVFSPFEVADIIKFIDQLKLENAFGVREVLYRNPDLQNLVFNQNLLELIKSVSPACNKSIKSIYFDKPPSANWVVNWHQDLAINVSGRIEHPEYKNWCVIEERTTVQPNVEMLESFFTIRIHLDDCFEQNGALRVVEKSHIDGVVDLNAWLKVKDKKERICELEKGDVLIIKPLVLHSSKRVRGTDSRRVFHLEFTHLDLPDGLFWNEKMEF